MIKPGQCPARCGRKRRVGELLCKKCWMRLPTRVRAPLFRDWKAANARLQEPVLWSRYLESRRIALLWLRTNLVAS